MRRVALLVFALIVGSGSVFSGSPANAAESNEPRKTEIYLSPYLLGTFPVDKNLSEEGNGFPTQTVQGTNLKSSFGAGLKAGVYPGSTGGILGLEAEFFGHGGRLKTPDGAFPSADAKLRVLNAMFNLLARYPGDVLQPYVGAGIGVSFATLSDINFQSNTGASSGKATDAALAVQFMAGMRAYVSKQAFLFGEYKYFGSNYKWESEVAGGGAGPDTVLNFRTHMVAAGLGVSF